MKKITFILIALITFSVSAQKKKNGIIYEKHPGIDLIDSFHKAISDGDLDKAASILHDDVSWLDGNTKNKEFGKKNNVLNNIKWFKNYFDYVSFKNSEGAYPDMLEYKNDGNWVQSWFHVYGVHKPTGVELDHPVLRIYKLNDDSTKITTIVEYSNKLEFRRIGNSRNNVDRENGKIYINHKNINTVRKTLYSFLNGDYEKSYSYWDENAVINDINSSEPISLEDGRKSNEQFLMNFTLDAIEEVGYPDYLEYDLNESKDVMSWWQFKITRKSDGKKITMPIHYIHGFNNDGKIINASTYYNGSLLK